MNTGSKSTANTARSGGAVESIRAALCLLLAMLLAVCMMPPIPQAEAAQNEPTMSVMMTMPDGRTADVTKVVMTLNGSNSAPVKFKVTSNVSPQSRTGWLVYELVDDDGSRDGRVLHHGGPEFSVTLDKIVASHDLRLHILEADNKNPSGINLYDKKLNIRIADTKKAESQVSSSGWSISNGLNITLNGSAPGGFFKDTKLVISPISLPVTYKHNPDGTTVVGINCNANDLAFYKAVKNKNVWQKYSDKALGDMAKGLNKGMSGKGVGTWGGKGQDWSIAGFAEFNTKNPEAPWSVTLVGTAGIKYSQSAQYFCLTGTVTGGAGVKFLGSLIRNPKADTYSGYLDGGGYGTIELFGGIGAGTIAAVGIYGRGRLEVMLGLLPKSNFGFKTVSVSGDAGLKAVAFGFDIVRWVVFEPKNSPYYIYDRDKKKAPNANVALAAEPEGGNESLPEGVSAPAATPADVSADAVYPELPRDYLNDDSAWTGGLTAASSADLSAQATTLVKNIYGATDLVCAETKSGPVVAYIADAEQVDISGRDSSNRSVLVYSRYQSDGSWSKPVPIDVADSTYGKTPDYNPAIFALPDSDDFYVAWLDARSAVASGETFGEIVKKLDVRFAKVGADGKVEPQTVWPKRGKSAPSGVSNGAPSLYVKKDPGRSPHAYVGWATNEATGDEGQVIGTSGKHDVYLASKDVNAHALEYWDYINTSTDSGAVTSLDVGMINGKPSVAWSVDRTYASRCKKADGSWSSVSMEELSSLNDSTAYKMTHGTATSSGWLPQVEKIADNATGIQAITSNGTPTMAYTTWARADEGGNFCSIYNASGNSLLLDGTTVGLPTPLTKIAGDIGKGANAGMVTCMRTTNAASVASLVKSGDGAKDWGKMVEATNAKGNITSYDVVYHNGAPMVVYTVASPKGNSMSAADDSDETTSMEVASGGALLDTDIEGVYYDEMEVNAGQVMPVSVEFTNDGIVPLDGADIYLYNEEIDSEPALMTTTSESVQPGDTGTGSFEVQLPERSVFDELGKEMQYYVLVVPKGTMGVTADTMLEEGDDTLIFKLGDPHLAVETEHRLVDGQESVVATVKNEGMVTSKPATLVFEEAEGGIDLERVEVPALAENETFVYEYKAPGGYFQNTNVADLSIMLEDPNDPDDTYSMYNSDSIHTWDIADDETPAATKPASSAPKTGDSFALGIAIALLALIILTSPIVARRIREAREG